MKKEIVKKTEEQLIEETKKISIKEASAYSFMDGFGVRYITPYALALGASNSQIGVLSAIPQLIGNLSQLYTLKEMNKWSRKKIVFTGVILQAIVWLFIISIGILPFVLGIKNAIAPSLLIFLYTLLILFGAFAGPAWNSWMKDLVQKGRGEYFAKRSMIASAIALICMLAAGFILDYFKQTKIFIGFIIIFFIAFMGRSIGAMLMLKQYEPEFKADKKAYFTLFEFIKKARNNNFGRYAIYTTLVMFAASIASPFFAVYLLKSLHFSYTSYIIISISSVIATLIFLPAWGRFSDKYGNVLTMRISGILIPFIPLLWMFSAIIVNYNSALVFIYLIAVEVFSGIAWAGFNLAAANFVFDAVTREKLAICIAYNNITSSAGVVLGALIGGWIASLNFNLGIITPLLAVFGLSAIVRLAVYLIMDPKINEVRPVESITERQAKDKLRKIISIHKFSEIIGNNINKIRPHL